MNTKLTKIKDTEILSAVPESGHVMAEVDGVVKRVPGNKVGGVPAGGEAGQVLTKTEEGAAWTTPESGLPEGGEPFKQLVTNSNGETVWEDRLAFKTGDKVLVNEKSVMLEGDIMPEGNVDADAYDDIVESIPYYVKFTSEYNNYDGYVEASKLENGNVGLKFSCSDSGFKVRVWKIDEKTFRVSLSSVPVPTKITISISAPGSIKPIDPPFLGGWKALGEGEPVKTAIIDNMTVMLEDAGGGMYVYGAPLEITAVAGTTYFVTWDGVDYECDAYEIADAPGIVMIGNASLFGFAGGNGEPFLIGGTGGSASIVGQDANTHTISMFINEAEIIPIPNNYLPLATQEAPGAIKVYKLPPVVAASIMERAIADMNAGSARVFFGNMELFYGWIENDVLYCAWVNDPARSCKVAKSEGKFNSSIWERNVYNTVIASDLYLGSGSGKVFRIQVSDDGTLSATEVT